MMNKIILPIFATSLAILFSSCTQRASLPNANFRKDKTVMLHWLNLDDKGLVRVTGNDGNFSRASKPFSGEAIETFEQSPTKSVSGWLDGKKHGTTTEYFYNGRIRRVVNFKNGIKNGKAEEYRITGELLHRENYLNGKLNGQKSDWHPNGTKIFEVDMRDGKPHGEAFEWYPDGLEKSSTVYRHGRREGPASEWYPNGQRKIGLFYQKDKQHGLRTVWYEDGQKRLTALFDDDMMEGKSQGWFPNGQIQFDYNFEDNLEHGICTEWDSNGKKISEIRFIRGKPSQDILTGQKISSPELKEEEQSKVSTTVVEDEKNGLQENLDKKKDLQKKEHSKSLEISPPNSSVLTSNPEPATEKIKSNSNNNVSTELPSTEIPTDKSLPPPPPVINDSVPTFDPFAQDPTKSSPSFESNLPAPPAAPPSFDPFEDKPLLPTSVQNPIPEIQTENGDLPPPPPPPPPPSTFDPFDSPPSSSPEVEAEQFVPPPPPPPSTNPFESTLPSIPAPSENSNQLNPFDSTEDGKEDNTSNSNLVPLQDVFSEPAANPGVLDGDINVIPPPPPPPPTFNPFDLPPPPQ
jgi:antitoxin component YwqK of YwqJK toxin-antitoxin module